jgi:hypothetical protein
MCQKLQSSDIFGSFIYAELKELSILILSVLCLCVWPHKERVLFVAEGDLRGEERLSDEINVIENFQQVVVSLKEEGYVLIAIRIGIDVEEVLLPLLDLIDNKDSQLPVVAYFQAKLDHRLLVILLEDRFLNIIGNTRHLCRDLMLD